jgi:hypothetical protein
MTVPPSFQTCASCRPKHDRDHSRCPRTRSDLRYLCPGRHQSSCLSSVDRSIDVVVTDYLNKTLRTVTREGTVVRTLALDEDYVTETFSRLKIVSLTGWDQTHSSNGQTVYRDKSDVLRHIIKTSRRDYSNLFIYRVPVLSHNLGFYFSKWKRDFLERRCKRVMKM